jgi:Amt family ammonium transporter
MLGTFVLWFGWYGFNCGTAILSDGPETELVASLAAVNTTLAAASAGTSALLLNWWITERRTGEALFDLKFLMNGALSGLVSITAGCAVLEPWAAVVTGLIGGVLYLLGSNGLVYLKLDDAVDAIPVHMLNGMWGLISVGLLAAPRHMMRAYGHDNHPGLFYSWYQGDSDFALLGVQLIGLLFIVGWVMVIMFPFFIWLDWKGWFRADALEEIVGLDTSYHGGLALLAGDEGGVNPEYISAYKQKKQDNMRRRHQAHNGRLGSAISDTVAGDSAREQMETTPDEMDEYHP